MRALKALLVPLLLAAACGDDSDPSTPTGVNPAPPGEAWDTLSQWGLFSDGARQVPADRVVAYRTIATLFADYAAKHRFLWLPPGETIGYSDSGEWDFPLGTIAVKTFSYPVDARDPSLGERLLETRLLVREQLTGWKSHTYVWNQAQTDATRKVAGGVIDTSWIDADGQTRTNAYAVPNTNECQECHGLEPDTRLLGVRTRQLNTDFAYPEGSENQIDRLARLGLLDSAPGSAGSRPTFVDPHGGADLIERARAYLDVNCGHCHSETGDAAEKGMFLDYEHTDPSGDPLTWGACKQPTSAGGATCGHVFDVVPGDPDTSVMICRMESEDPDDQMPPLGRNIRHDEGVELIRAWIAAMPANDCSGP